MKVRIPSHILASRRRSLATLVACGALVIGGPVAVAQAAADADANAGGTVHFAGLPPVGALFASADYTGSTAAHFCTATVIDSPAGDLVLTAAHCVAGASQGAYTPGQITFAPGYDDGPNARLEIGRAHV